MAEPHFCHFIRFLDSGGSPVPGRAFQNYWPGETRERNSTPYVWAPFVVDGGAFSLGGDQGEAKITSLANDLAYGVLAEASQRFWLVEIEIVEVVISPGTPDTWAVEDCAQTITYGTPPTMTDGGSHSITLFAADAFENGVVKTGRGEDDREDLVSLVLASPFNVVSDLFPGRVLSQSIVGSIPSSGNIVTQ